jgi:hypothetical protein
MNIREFYVKNYPSDDMGDGINPNATFDGLWEILNTYGDVYEYLYVYDSIIRERVFEKLAANKGCEYDVIYYQWLKTA